MKLQGVDVTRLAERVVAELVRTEPHRKVAISIHPGMRAQADENLLRIVLDNLIGNAWKFTGKKDEALIEMGIATGEHDPVFFVRDNGAGFDMKYADMLFGAFRRLHKATEFEGTGIGLATVQRIINRHGGKTWAEGAVGKGATFYFSLISDGVQNVPRAEAS
jgi:light-regulated signal transduction histidine kinase (bacteriophytochrome)